MILQLSYKVLNVEHGFCLFACEVCFPLSGLVVQRSWLNRGQYPYLPPWMPVRAESDVTEHHEIFILKLKCFRKKSLQKILLLLLLLTFI